MSSPKVVILGAGSLFFGRKAIWQMVHSPILQNGTLALVDTDADRLNKMKSLAEKVIAHNKVPLKLEASTDRKDVLKDADFIVLSFADRNAHFRGIDVQTSAAHGIRMCSGDTIGPGGVFRAMRELPEIFRACKDIETLCPDAWVINYINPASVNGIGIMRYFPHLKSLALCDAQYGLRANYAKMAGVKDDEKFTLLTAGPNHFTWVMKAEYDGKDVLPKLVEGMRANADKDANEQAQGGSTYAKGWLNNAIAIELYEAFGMLPTVVSHSKEYVRFYQGRSMLGLDKNPSLKLFEHHDRHAWTASVWKRVDDYLSGAVEIAEFDKEFGPDPATHLIEIMWGNTGQPFFVNTKNNGAISNMADDAFVELYCDIDMTGPRPHPVGPMPRGLRAMCETILDTHELNAQGIYEEDPAIIRRCLLTDPLTSSIGDIDALIKELLHHEKSALPDCWYPAKKA